jgi:hypothetical protein
MSEWQPIDTAPKDGTLVDLFAGGERRCHCAWVDYSEPLGSDPEDGEWLQQYAEHITSWFKVHETPTHWMPIPKGPE